jgi:hypothetical protein
MAAFTTLARERFHMFSVCFTYEGQLHNLKVFINHGNRNKYFILFASNNQPVKWDHDLPGEVLDNVLTNVKAEIGLRLRDDSWVDGSGKADVVKNFVTTAQKNLCMHVLAVTGGDASERFRFFFEFKPRLGYCFWTSNPENNDLGTPGETITLDEEAINAARACASVFLQTQNDRRTAAYTRRQSSGLGDQIAAVIPAE